LSHIFSAYNYRRPSKNLTPNFGGRFEEKRVREEKPPTISLNDPKINSYSFGRRVKEAAEEG
jgi:hypothetical protein